MSDELKGWVRERPVRIAFLVEDGEHAHTILDGVIASCFGWAAAGLTDTELGCFSGTGGGSWDDGRSAASTSSKRSGWCGIGA